MKPRILFFLSNIVTGGAERQTVLLAKHLGKLGYPCELLAYYAAHSKIIVDDEIRPRTKFVSGKSMRNLLEWRKAWSAIADLKPDIIVSVNPSVLPIAILGRAFGFYDASIACTLHTTVLANRNMRLTFPISRLALLSSDCLVYVCNAQQAYWKKRGLRARTETVIHNGIDPSDFDPRRIDESAETLRSRLGFAATDFVIGMTAMFRPEKNHGQAVEALAQLRGADVPAKLLFVGDGNTRAAIVRQVEACGLQSHVVFAGCQDDVRPFLKSMDVGLLCSTRGETFSLAALEAMAMTVPMVMPRMSGCVELVEGNRGGRLFGVGNTDELVMRLRELCDPIVREKAAREARAVVAERFTEEAMVEKYARLFNRLAGDANLSAQ